MNPFCCALLYRAIREISDCSSALSPEISVPWEVSRSIAIAKHPEPRLPAKAFAVGDPINVPAVTPVPASMTSRKIGIPPAPNWATEYLKSCSGRVSATPFGFVEAKPLTPAAILQAHLRVLHGQESL